MCETDILIQSLTPATCFKVGTGFIKLCRFTFNKHSGSVWDLRKVEYSRGGRIGPNVDNMDWYHY